MRRSLSLAVLLALGSSAAIAQPGGGGTPITPGAACPPGMTLIRPDNCRGPNEPVPSILDYRPKSMLKAPANPRMKAKFPVIDYHGHPRNLMSSVESLGQLAASLDSINVRM